MYTIGQIAERLGVPVHQVKYAILSRRIDPRNRAGRYRLFAEEDVAAIAAALRATGAVSDSRVMQPPGERRG